MPRGSLGTLASLAEEGELEDLEAGVEHVPLAGKRRKQGCQRLIAPSISVYESPGRYPLADGSAQQMGS